MSGFLGPAETLTVTARPNQVLSLLRRGVFLRFKKWVSEPQNPRSLTPEGNTAAKSQAISRRTTGDTGQGWECDVFSGNKLICHYQLPSEGLLQGNSTQEYTLKELFISSAYFRVEPVPAALLNLNPSSRAVHVFGLSINLHNLCQTTVYLLWVGNCPTNCAPAESPRSKEESLLRSCRRSSEVSGLLKAQHFATSKLFLEMKHGIQLQPQPNLPPKMLLLPPSESSLLQTKPHR